MSAALTLHTDALREYARRLTHGQSDVADDIFQQTCLQAWRNKHRVDYSKCCKPWLLRIMKNEYLQHIRKSAYKREVSDQGILEGHPATLASSLDIELMDLLDGLSNLPPRQRQAILLVLAYGYTYDEAANIAGSQSGTMKSRVARGRERLVELISSQEAA